jgi:KDO2-lipid IV(A) lauroyltransferase
VSFKSIRHRCEYGLTVLAIAVMRLAGVDASASVFGWLARVIGPRTRRHQQSLRNLAIAFPDLSADDHARIAHAMWDNMGRVAAELLLVDLVIADPTRVDIHGTEGLEAAVRNRVPQVGATPHAGNWELTIWPVKRLGGDPGAVYRPLANPYIDKLVRSRRSELFSGGLFAKGKEEGPRAAKALIDFVRGGGWLGFVCDHVDRRGVDVMFLGQPVRVSYVPALIARHTDAWMWVARTVRLGTKSRFRLDAVRLDVPITDDKRHDAHDATRMIFKQFEAWIREHPEQWQWWNLRPTPVSLHRQTATADTRQRVSG